MDTIIFVAWVFIVAVVGGLAGWLFHIFWNNPAKFALEDEKARLESLLAEARGSKPSGGGGEDVVLRLAREVAAIIEMRKGQRPGRSEAIVKLTAVLVEQLGLSFPQLPEAIYLRDIGQLAVPDMMVGGTPTAVAGPEWADEEHTKIGFEILSRVRLPSACL